MTHASCVSVYCMLYLSNATYRIHVASMCAMHVAKRLHIVCGCVVTTDHDLITVGETPFTHDASVLAAYVLPQNKELNMVFHFELMDLDSPPESPLVKKAWRLAELKALVRRWQTYKRTEGFWNA